MTHLKRTFIWTFYGAVAGYLAAIVTYVTRNQGEKQ